MTNYGADALAQILSFLVFCINAIAIALALYTTSASARASAQSRSHHCCSWWYLGFMALLAYCLIDTKRHKLSLGWPRLV